MQLLKRIEQAYYDKILFRSLQPNHPVLGEFLLSIELFVVIIAISNLISFGNWFWINLYSRATKMHNVLSDGAIKTLLLNLNIQIVIQTAYQSPKHTNQNGPWALDLDHSMDVELYSNDYCMD